MEVGSAEFSIGDAEEADVFLETHDVADSAVFDLAQLRSRELAGAKAPTCLEERRRAQKAAHVIGAKRRF